VPALLESGDRIMLRHTACERDCNVGSGAKSNVAVELALARTFTGGGVPHCGKPYDPIRLHRRHACVAQMGVGSLILAVCLFLLVSSFCLGVRSSSNSSACERAHVITTRRISVRTKALFLFSSSGCRNHSDASCYGYSHLGIVPLRHRQNWRISLAANTIYPVARRALRIVVKNGATPQNHRRPYRQGCGQGI
jgi:hypothetical protein